MPIGVEHPRRTTWSAGKRFRSAEWERCQTPSIHLFALAEARRDLWDARFWTKSTEPESLLAEETVVDNPLTGWLDDLIFRLVAEAY